MISRFWKRLLLTFAVSFPTLTAAQAHVASCYGGEHRHNLCGSRTANGERLDCRAMTAAHRTLPFGTILYVTNLRNGRSIRVRINDRGPFVRGRHIDLSIGACRALGIDGLAPVRF